MTRRDYVMLSGALRNGRGAAHQRQSPDFEVGRRLGYSQAGIAIADAMKRNNQHFDVPRFIEEAGL